MERVGSTEQQATKTHIPGPLGSVIQRILENIEARNGSENQPNASPSGSKGAVFPQTNGEDSRTTRPEWQLPPTDLDLLSDTSSSPVYADDAPPGLPCLGGCGQLLEPFWDDGWRRPAPTCDACELAIAEQARDRELAAQWANARLPMKFRGFSLDRTASQQAQESDLAFVQRIETLPQTVGVLRHNVHAILKLRAWLNAPSISSFWLRGRAGVGKTLLLCAVARHLLEAGVDVLFCHEPDFFAQLAFERNLSVQPGGILYDARNCGVLLMDGANASPHRADPPKPWMARALTSLVNARYNADLPILWTSENSLAEYTEVWREAFGDDPGDGFSGRLCEMCNRREIALDGFNWRVEGWEEAAG